MSKTEKAAGKGLGCRKQKTSSHLQRPHTTLATCGSSVQGGWELSEVAWEAIGNRTVQGEWLFSRDVSPRGHPGSSRWLCTMHTQAELNGLHACGLCLKLLGKGRSGGDRIPNTFYVSVKFSTQGSFLFCFGLFSLGLILIAKWYYAGISGVLHYKGNVVTAR